ncbi:MAG: dynamin family protein [Phascolarctobacterium sp.]|uniref:dynamin family protein n=1 Tax=Phascolarctobacterium sp. TaxID=2049039 RepID=UPI0026DA97E9|nr:dynamin family protein [Phascolarctobacterium sp.]MDO4921344.1 dynamin family protein [Phascolarctobacterium sp.]
MQDLKLTAAQRRLQEDAARLADERFNLVVIGEFSRGKSTFVNAMLGKAILPASKEATTNVISKIVYGDTPQFKLFYKDGKEQQITKDEFDLIKAQTENKPDKFAMLHNIAAKVWQEKHSIDFGNIAYAQIAYPLDFCANQVDVVDTPGTNDLNVGRIEITYRYLRQAEAAILVLSAAQLLTETEKEFLVEQVVGNNIKDIFIVINYKDEVVGQEERLIKYALDNLVDVQDFSQRIFMVSSKQALLYRRRENGETLKPTALLNCPNTLEETGFPEFERALGKFLSEEKGAAKLRKYAARCQLALKEAERDIGVKQEGLNHSLDDLKQKLFEERPKFTKTKREAERIVQYLQTQLLSGQMEVEQLADAAVNKIKQAAMGAVDGYRGDINALDSQEIKQLVEAAVTPVQKQFLTDINELQQKLLQENVSEAADTLRKLWQDMEFDADALPITNAWASLGEIQTDGGGHKNNTNNSLGIAIGSYLVAGALFGGPVGIVAAAAGWFLSGGGNPFADDKVKIKEQVRRQYAANLQGFSEKIGEQYKRNAQQVCRDLQSEVEERLSLMNEQLQALIEQKESKAQSVEEIRAGLQRQQEQINALYVKLEAVVR